MDAAPKIPGDDGWPARTRAVVLWIALFVAAGGAIGLTLSPLWPGTGEPVAAQSSAPLSPEETCLRLSENPSEYLSEEAMNRRTELRLASCGWHSQRRS